MLLAGGILLVIASLRSKMSLRMSKRVGGCVVLLAVTGFYLANVCEFLGLREINSSKACFIYGLSPFISALFSYIQLREIVTWKKIGGLSLGLIGYLSYLIFGGKENSSGWTWQIGVPEFLVLCATCLAAFGWTVLRKIEKISLISVTVINAYAMLIAGVLSLVHSAAVESWSPLPIENMSLFLKATFSLVLVSNLICYNLYAKLLRKYSSTFLSFCNLVMPLFSAFYGWILLGEGFSLGLVFAVTFMVIGCRLIYHEEFHQGYIIS
ncbi:Permease of the drug/metabolite transporter (DMT) superfamily [Candidatus Chlamydia sanziniae]|uniref:Permease of the drug/metabolite transporter (DMT) superfamily n=2 Tax=Candidatus Chlamydia sanziniae TaxID=1806891 RepID=A0A1A9HV79_9CHLA|nr:Permease of the drug/metabolite transporter (DMT) superfamily [Candidatus Chlamydia sanziniae]